MFFLSVLKKLFGNVDLKNNLHTQNTFFFRKKHFRVNNPRKIVYLYV